jgi:hypothetical protein
MRVAVVRTEKLVAETRERMEERPLLEAATKQRPTL